MSTRLTRNQAKLLCESMGWDWPLPHDTSHGTSEYYTITTPLLADAEARLTRLVDGLNNILLIYQWDAAQTAAIQALIKEARSD